LFLSVFVSLCSKALQKKSTKRVKWSDHFGGNLSVAKTIESDEVQVGEEASTGEASVSWSDRKKRDRLREKELLAQVK
jgi:hypothetical protein